MILIFIKIVHDYFVDLYFLVVRISLASNIMSNSSVDNYHQSEFEPLYITIQGAGGTGKSTVIHVIVSILENIFYDDVKVTITSAPTGSASFNIGGTTSHSQFGINCQNPENELTQTRLNIMKEQMRYTVALIFDERSMYSACVLGACEKHCREAMHNGMNKKKPWGHVPIIIMAGDDHQLPSVNKYNRGRGATYTFDEDMNKVYMNGTNIPTGKAAENECRGFDQFIDLATNVVEFRKTHRVHEGQKQLTQILESMREKGGVTNEQAEILMNRNLMTSGKISQTRKEWLNRHATWIYPTNNQVTAKNYLKMKEIVTPDNPICNVFAQMYRSSTNAIGKPVKSHFNKDDKDAAKYHSSTCRGSLNALDRNLFAEKGLYNGAPVRMLEIRFKKGENPNVGDEPAYFLADCPTYTGPAFCTEHPTWVPIPMVQTMCRYKCCYIRQAPLQLAFARTGQKFQGQQVGPEHPIKAIIADPGTLQNESRCPGYTYMICSRVSTLGQNVNESSLYFTGNDVNEDRFTNLTHKRSGDKEKYVSVQRRDNWIKFIRHRKTHTNFNIDDRTKSQLKKWATETKINKHQLSTIIEYHANFKTST